MKLTREQKREILEMLAKDIKGAASDIACTFKHDGSREAAEFIESVADWMVTHHPSQRYEFTE